MAQSVTDIENEIIAEMANHPELSSLNNTTDPTSGSSNVLIWRAWMFVTASIISLFEGVMDLFKIDIQNIIVNNQYGTNGWWYTQLLAFQYGDLLVFINNIFQYPAVDTSKQIIQFCSISSLNGAVQIKVAGSSGGQPAVLTSDQLAGVISYCTQIQPAGIRFSAISLAADLLTFYGTIFYDATGDITVIQAAVEAAITNFLSTNNVNNFNGTLFVNKLIDAIQAVPGIVGDQVEVTSIAAKNGGNDYTTFVGSYQPESGYFIIDPANPLSTTLTYTPYLTQ